ncbi:MAG: hypothetical protein EOO93_31700 [Pedobacter sp.]|nr:MAG: hypothetical protein EOO93_31700 [Pedobacter sp.]
MSNILSFDLGAHFDFKSEEIDTARIEVQENKLPKFLKYIEELTVLTGIKEGNGKEPIKINTKSNGYLKVTSTLEIMFIADFMRERRINELKSSSYDLIFDIDNIENWSSLHFQDYANKLRKKPVGDKVQKFLSMSVSQTILKYLKAEKLLMSKHDEVNMSQKQGVVIYTFLLVFNILKKSQGDTVRSAEDKAKYIHSLIDKKKNLKGINIAQLEWEEMSIEKYLSDYQDVTIPHRF